MKSRYFFVLLLLTGLAVTGLVGKSANSSPEATRMKPDSSSIPPQIFKIMEQSCLECHGTGGKAMAMAKLKLSEWDGYSSSKQAQKAAAICKMVTGGKMPPKGYLKNNPKAALVQAQIDSLCAWSDLLNKGK